MTKLKDLLNEKAAYYNNPSFIENDPISIPHLFTLKQDREIVGFFASILAWGQRKTIINKCHDLIKRFEGEPYNFIKEHSEEDLRGLMGFKHRTFNDTDLLYFVDYFKRFYDENETFEDAFLPMVVSILLRSHLFILNIIFLIIQMHRYVLVNM